MKFCQDHWTRLREAIDARGLSVLVAEGGEKAVANFASEVQNGLTIDNYDPLMSAHMAILENAMRLLGAEVLTTPPGYPECPICLLNRVHDEVCAGEPCVLPRDGTAYDDWIERAADDQVEVWKEMRP